MIQAVIFDLDGLLIDSEPLWRMAEQAAFRQVDIHMSEADCRLTMGNSTRQVVAYWRQHRPWKGKSNEYMEADILQRVSTLIKEKSRPMPGVQRILGFFHRKNLPMAVASSSPMELIVTATERLGIKHYFNLLHSAWLEKEAKPHPAVYLGTAQRLKVHPDTCLVFEDSYIGIKAAKLADMRVVAVPDKENRSNPLFGIADLVIPSLNAFGEDEFTDLNT